MEEGACGAHGLGVAPQGSSGVGDNMRGYFTVAMTVAAAIALSSPTLACRTSAQMRSYLFASLPSVPPGAVAARVEVVASGDWRRPEMKARIISMLSGPRGASMVRIAPAHVTNCDILPAVGSTGILVGRLISVSNGELVVEPIAAPLPHSSSLPS
jgi:hypothetical protein